MTHSPLVPPRGCAQTHAPALNQLHFFLVMLFSTPQCSTNDHFLCFGYHLSYAAMLYRISSLQANKLHALARRPRCAYSYKFQYGSCTHTHTLTDSGSSFLTPFCDRGGGMSEGINGCWVLTHWKEGLQAVWSCPGAFSIQKSMSQRESITGWSVWLWPFTLGRKHFFFFNLTGLYWFQKF